MLGSVIGVTNGGTNNSKGRANDLALIASHGTVGLVGVDNLHMLGDAIVKVLLPLLAGIDTTKVDDLEGGVLALAVEHLQRHGEGEQDKQQENDAGEATVIRKLFDR